MQEFHAALVAARLPSGRRTLRAVDYLRVSTEEQARGYGIAYSGKKTAGYISQKGWVASPVFDGPGGQRELAPLRDLRAMI